MSRNSLLIGRALALAVAGVLAAGPALADKPSWAGEKGGKGHANEHRQGDQSRGSDRDSARQSQAQGYAVSVNEHFGDRHRIVVREYYGGQMQSGHCPPGLAKKHNGCMPPGQAKKWSLGRPLPQDVIYYDVPRSLVVQLGVPPEGHRYVRVAGDILMIAVGTSLVVDAIQDLGR